MTQTIFDHEKLFVYQRAIQFVAWAEDLLQELADNKINAKDHLDRASTSIVLNVAEGNGKISALERRRYLLTARGSSVESAACLDIFVAKRLVDENRILPGKELLLEIVRMLMGLIGRLESQVREEEGEYIVSGGVELEQEQE